jgi:hypothetical protein
MRPHGAQHRCHLVESARRRSRDLRCQVAIDNGSEMRLELVRAASEGDHRYKIVVINVTKRCVRGAHGAEAQPANQWDRQQCRGRHGEPAGSSEVNPLVSTNIWLVKTMQPQRSVTRLVDAHEPSPVAPARVAVGRRRQGFG